MVLRRLSPFETIFGITARRCDRPRILAAVWLGGGRTASERF